MQKSRGCLTPLTRSLQYRFSVCQRHRIIDDRIEKYDPTSSFSQSRIAAMRNEESTALAHPPTTPFPTPGWAVGNGGGRRVRQGSTSPPNLILTQSLHLKYTCGKRAVSNSSSFYTLFYSVIYNSVVRGLPRMKQVALLVSTEYNVHCSYNVRNLLVPHLVT